LEPTCKIYSLFINLQNLIVYFNSQFVPQSIILQYAKNVYSILNSTLLTLILFYSIPKMYTVFQTPVCSPWHYFTVCQKMILYIKLQFASQTLFYRIPKTFIVYFKLQFVYPDIILQYTTRQTQTARFC